MTFPAIDEPRRVVRYRTSKFGANQNWSPSFSCAHARRLRAAFLCESCSFFEQSMGAGRMLPRPLSAIGRRIMDDRSTRQANSLCHQGSAQHDQDGANELQMKEQTNGLPSSLA